MASGDFRNVSEGFSGFPRVFPRCSIMFLREFQRDLKKLCEGFEVFSKVSELIRAIQNVLGASLKGFKGFPRAFQGCYRSHKGVPGCIKGSRWFKGFSRVFKKSSNRSPGVSETI